MGFFSSIGKVFKSVAAPVAGVLGTVLGGPAGGALGYTAADAVWGSDKSGDRYNEQVDFARSQDQFSRDYIQNAIQWRVADAKKAGVHPMAALGISSPQYSAASMPAIPGDTQSIDPMEFGQSLNYASTKAKDRQQQAQMVDLQMRGLELDNEYKQAQIDALKVDTLASSIASNQALQSPANPTVNAKEPINVSQGFGKGSSPSAQGVHRLFDIGLYGSSAMLIPNPDIADSISESTWNTVSANLIREIEMGNPDIIDDFISKLPKGYRSAINDGRMRLTTVPGSGVIRIVDVEPDQVFDRYKLY